VRWLLTIVLIAVPVVAFAKPKVAVAPLDGDSGNKIADIVVDAADDHAKVTRPEKVSRAMDTLSISELTSKSLKKLRTDLEVDVVIHGSVEKEGSKHKLTLQIAGKGKHKATVEMSYKTTRTCRRSCARRSKK